MTLSDLAYYVRKFGPFALIGFILFIIFYLVIQMIFTAIQNRPVEEVYTPAFGELPPIEFTHTIDYPADFSLTIDNIEGRPITASDSAEIFFIPQARTSFGYQQAIGLMAKAVGINTQEQRYTLNETTAAYDDGLRKLEVDITTFNFSYELAYQRTPDIFRDAYIPEESRILEEAKTHLRQMSRYPEALSKGTTNIIYQQYDPQNDALTVVQDPTQANVVEVDFFPPDIAGLPVVPPKYPYTSNYVVMVFREAGNLVIKSQIKHFPPDLEQSGPYPLKTGDQAWEELKNRKGTIVSPATGAGTTNIIVKNMFLAYYEPDTYQEFLMPVYVFLGENGFAAYVSAVDEGYIEGGTSSDVTPAQ